VKQVHGIWLPDGDIHIAEHLGKGPEYKGKGTYQFAKIEACILACEGAKRTNVAIDVGAHVGTWSRVLVDSFEHVVAFEPMHHLFECLERNLEGVENIHLNNWAVAAANGYVDMIKAVENSGNCRVAVERDRAQRTKLRCIALDSYERAFRGGVDFIKIDTEGYEVPVIVGAEQLIKTHRPFVMIEQKHAAHGFGQFEAFDLLKSWGMVEVYARAGDYLLRFQ
jgi:FkbM family methyltransferase